MIRKEGRDINRVSFGSVVIGKIMKGGALVWEFITSCFSKGYWINNYGYKNDKPWKNNK